MIHRCLHFSLAVEPKVVLCIGPYALLVACDSISTAKSHMSEGDPSGEGAREDVDAAVR